MLLSLQGGSLATPPIPSPRSGSPHPKPNDVIFVLLFFLVTYHMVGNFREGFIFVHVSCVKSHWWKLKQRNFCCPCAKWFQFVLCGAIWPLMEACQQLCLWRLSLKPSMKLMCYVQTDARTRQRCKAESGSNHFSEPPGYEATFPPRWNKKLRLPSLSPSEQFAQLLATQLANPRVPDSLTMKIKTAKIYDICLFRKNLYPQKLLTIW